MIRTLCIALAFVSACSTVEGEQEPRTGAFCSLSCVPTTDHAFLYEGATPTFVTEFSTTEPVDCRFESNGTRCVYVEHLTCEECAAAASEQLPSCEPRVLGEDGSSAITLRAEPVPATCG